MKTLVCGGAGYIGAHMCRLLAVHGHTVTVLDDLSTGHEAAVRWGPLVIANLCDAQGLEAVFDRVQPDCVLHFAAKSIVPESVRNPAEYYRNNVLGSYNLLEQVRRVGARVIFSSTAAVYGEPQTLRLQESHCLSPINAYGRSKLAIEHLLQDYWSAYAVPSVAFRYFNAAGAEPEASIGEAHGPETHLIPRLLESALGRLPAIAIFGDDYDTADGTCVRDYVHVNDICQAHLAGIALLTAQPGAHLFNLGNGDGYSVLEVIEAASRVIGRAIEVTRAPRRSGDPARLVADAGAAREVLGWVPQTAQLEAIIASAWHWHQDRSF
jgi:UDP-glucose 4-epimerase